MPRRKQFHPDLALRQAMELFWERGYEATSIQDLLDRMGINRFSLYDTFGGKRDLFDAVLARYREEEVSPSLEMLAAGREGILDVRRYFDTLLTRIAGPGGWWGCLLVNTAVELAPRDRGAADHFNRHREGMQEALYQALVRARKAGEVGSVVPARQLARFLAGVVLSLDVLARTRAPAPELRRQVELALSVLEGGTPTSASESRG